MEDENQKKIKDEIVARIKSIGEDIRESSEDVNIKAAKMDVLLDTMKFLEHYDENVKALNNYWYNKRFEIREEER